MIDNTRETYQVHNSVHIVVGYSRWRVKSAQTVIIAVCEKVPAICRPATDDHDDDGKMPLMDFCLTTLPSNSVHIEVTNQ